MRTIFILLCLFLGGVLAGQKPAVVANDKEGWHKIAETTVDLARERDEVAVLAADKFAALRFSVKNASIELLDIDVTFEDGDTQNIRVGFAVKPKGTSSREIDLSGGAERAIKKIGFHYRTLPNRNNKKARLEIWGKKTNRG